MRLLHVHATLRDVGAVLWGDRFYSILLQNVDLIFSLLYCIPLILYVYRTSIFS